MANNKVEIENNLTSIRSLIAKHKRHDHIFAGVGMFIIISLTITLLILFLDLVFDEKNVGQLPITANINLQ